MYRTWKPPELPQTEEADKDAVLTREQFLGEVGKFKLVLELILAWLPCVYIIRYIVALMKFMAEISGITKKKLVREPRMRWIFGLLSESLE
jgi:hypothetical protein